MKCDRCGCGKIWGNGKKEKKCYTNIIKVHRYKCSNCGYQWVGAKVRGSHLVSKKTRELLRQKSLGNTNMADAIARGFKHTPEMLQKMRLAMLGKKRPPGVCAKLSLAHKGHHRHTEYQRQRTRETHLGKSFAKGRVMSDEEKEKHRLATIEQFNNLEARIKLSKQMMGENNPQWRGGSSNVRYTREFNRIIKRLVRQRDGFKCQICGVPESECLKRLDIHHIDYNKKHTEVSNLVSLCRSCHQKVNNHRDYWVRYFEGKIKNIERSSIEVNYGCYS